MFLSIDVGNTQTAIGLFDNKGHYGARLKCPPIKAIPLIFCTDAQHTFFQKDGLNLDDIEAGGLSALFLLSTCLGAALNYCLTNL